MRRFGPWIALAVVVVIALVVLAMNVGTPKANVGRNLVDKKIDWHVKTLEGEELTSTNQLGKTVVINFWNTWCIPCIQEAPALHEFYDRHKDEADFVMIGIVRDDTENAVRTYVEEKHVGWQIAMDDDRSRASIAFGVTGQPETFVIGPAGRVGGEQRGLTNLEDLEAMLNAARGRV
jgi:thiol-disulfide isomerase/thioredoxin